MHPPLDTTFFRKVRELGQLPLQATLTDFAAGVGIPDPFGRHGQRMEEFFGDVFFELSQTGAGDPDHERALDSYRSLLRLYTRVLASTTNWYHDRPLGVVGRHLRSLLDRGATRISLITFNHDLTLENAVAQLPYRQRWCVDSGYGPMHLSPTPTQRSGPRLPRHSPECDHSVEIEILKLHGSLNWQVQTRSHEPAHRDLFPDPTSSPQIDCVIDRVVSLTLRRRRGNRTWRLWPQIVPPIYGKQSIITARFEELWRHAGEQMSQADSITVAGYSLPPTDSHAANLIKRGIRRNRNIDQVTVVNPDPAIAARIAEIADLDSVVWHRSFADLARAQRH